MDRSLGFQTSHSSEGHAPTATAGQLTRAFDMASSEDIQSAMLARPDKWLNGPYTEVLVSVLRLVATCYLT